MTSAWLDALNPEQRRAATHGGAGAGGPLLVIAGAGTGKTATLAHRVAHPIVSGADPNRILLLTFSRRAAAEMGRRVERIVGAAWAAARPPSLPWSGTFHAVGARLLREYAAGIGLLPDFTILDREDSADLMNIVRHELGLSKTETRFPQRAPASPIYSRAVNAEAPLAEVLKEAFPWCPKVEAGLRDLFAAYVETKQRQAVLDYDDLLLYWAGMMEDGAIAADLSARFDHVLVDEYQDTNRLQASILLRLKPDGRGLTVVGDDAQSIYSFRAARVRNILDFPAAFAPAAEIVTLEQNYRSTQPVLAAANAVIGLAAERFTKNLRSGRLSSDLPELVTVRDETDQARCVVERILENREAGMLLKRQAVLFRASHHSAGLELELTRRNIPFVKYRRAEIPRRRPRQGRARLPPLRGESARPHRRLPAAAAHPRHRPDHRRPPARRHRRGRRRAERACQASRRRRAPPRTGRPSPRSIRRHGQGLALAGRGRARPRLVPAASRAGP